MLEDNIISNVRHMIQSRIQNNEMPSYIYNFPRKTAYRPFNDWKTAVKSWETVTGDIALYIHIPFCEMKCSFCDLFTVTNLHKSPIMMKYIQSILKEIDLMKEFINLNEVRVNSIYFGGGTPSLLSSSQLAMILSSVRNNFKLNSNIEISIEGAPNSFTHQKFQELINLGFNRVSIGIQSFIENELVQMGRKYDPTLGESMASLAIQSGFQNVNLDLIYGIPGQSFSNWQYNLHKAIAIGPQTITAYPLIVRNRTAYGRCQAIGKHSDFSDECLRYKYYDYLIEQLTLAGYQQHTLVTFAKNRGGCQYEEDGFSGLPTLSFGAGARKYAPNMHYVDDDYNHRIPNKITMMKYIEQIEQHIIPVLSAVVLSPKDHLKRYVILALLSSGIQKEKLSALLNTINSEEKEYYSLIFKALKSESLLIETDKDIKLTSLGKKYSSIIGDCIAETSWYHFEPLNAFWERGYRNINISSMGGPSFEVVEVAKLLPKSARILDLGCGEGRNALYLAGLGHFVRAIDHSDAGIQKLKTIAGNAGITLEAKVASLETYTIEEEYDCVMAHGVLYYLDKPLWKNLLRQIKAKTKFNGFNIFTVFIYDEEYPCTDEIKTAHYKNSFEPFEIQEFYCDWEELRFDRYVKWDAHPGIPMHYHPIEKLVAQKIDPESPKNWVKTTINSTVQLTWEQFQQINMGIDINEIIKLAGTPDIIEKINANGLQYGINLDSQENSRVSLVNGYNLELWYYENKVIYITNGQVSGKAIFRTVPMKIQKIISGSGDNNPL